MPQILTELEDLPWFPSSWREVLTDLMNAFDSIFKPYRPIIPRLKQAMEALNCGDIVDLCSGGGGPSLGVAMDLQEKEHYPVHLVLTDKYPNLQAYRRAAEALKGMVSYRESPVDARNVPADLKGFRTLFTSFHHFRPGEARKILEDAAACQEGIGVFEYTEPSLVWFLAVLLIPLILWLGAPFIRPFRWSRLLWVYLLPLPVLAGVWDAFVSLLRSYSEGELLKLASGIGAGRYVWEAGKVRSFGACYVTYLIGYPHETGPELASGSLLIP